MRQNTSNNLNCFENIPHFLLLRVTSNHITYFVIFSVGKSKHKIKYDIENW